MTAPDEIAALRLDLPNVLDGQRIRSGRAELRVGLMAVVTDQLDFFAIQQQIAPFTTNGSQTEADFHIVNAKRMQAGGFWRPQPARHLVLTISVETCTAGFPSKERRTESGGISAFEADFHRSVSMGKRRTSTLLMPSSSGWISTWPDQPQNRRRMKLLPRSSSTRLSAAMINSASKPRIKFALEREYGRLH